VASWSSWWLRFCRLNLGISRFLIRIYFSVFTLGSVSRSAEFRSGQRRFDKKWSSNFRIEKDRHRSTRAPIDVAPKKKRDRYRFSSHRSDVWIGPFDISMLENILLWSSLAPSLDRPRDYQAKRVFQNCSRSCAPQQPVVNLDPPNGSSRKKWFCIGKQKEIVRNGQGRGIISAVDTS
jgi:hypothetical protein